MTSRRRSSAALFLFTGVSALATPVLHADEVVLKDGSIHVGKTRTVGEQVEIRTLDGVIRVQRSKVDWERTRNDRQLRTDFARLVGQGTGSSARHLELTLTAKQWGLHEEMWKHLGIALRTTPGTHARYGRIRRFMAGLEPAVLPRKWRQAKPQTKMSRLLAGLGSKSSFARIATVAELLANLPQVDAQLKKRARTARNPLHRIAAVRAIFFRPAAIRSPRANERFVYRTALLDGSAAVREHAMRSTMVRDKSRDAVAYMAPMLGHENKAVRIRTAEAFGVLRDPSALPHLAVVHPTIAKRRGNGIGGSTRAHMMSSEQRTYVRDFDVEIAQASAVANPKIGVVRSGVVFDVTVISGKSYSIEVIQAQRNALRRVAGADPGPDRASGRHG